MPGSSAGSSASKSSARSITACGATSMPHDATKRFSAIRSCAIATLAASGLTLQCSARNSSAAAGTFSNSVVAARQRAASSASPVRSR